MSANSNSETISCWVYRCVRRPETYLFLAKEDGADALPEQLRSVVGPLELVIHIELHAGRPLARASAQTVMADLKSQGYYLQLPPNKVPTHYAGHMSATSPSLEETTH
ncbi:MAG: YcgL domain-containing protein [Chromatiales bacterium]|jgi:uncharacterized protein|nr:YcgL domain-containing protein [Chromatiales bacterium]